jgi:hypothetical protein
VATSLQHNNEPPGSIKDENSRGQPSDYQLLMKDYAPRSVTFLVLAYEGRSD